MNTLALFLIEVLICIGISFSVLYLLKPLLRQILIDTCGNQTRAEFWVMFTQLMLFIAPLLIVIFFAPTQEVTTIHVTEVIQATLFRSLLGVFLALTMIGQVIWKSIDTSTEPLTSGLEQHQDLSKQDE
ncbi:MAG: hypothetical protein OEW99_00825 [Gammaproteobacteria bacterium]|nr:hypothetical protein [Gammaproteobacteria bacterium]